MNYITEIKFYFKDLSPEDKIKTFDIFSKSYTDKLGVSWDLNKFNSRANDWTFYGEISKGFITVRKQRTGLNKLAGVAGDVKSIIRGLDDLIAENEPIWGMADGAILKMALKKGFIKPPSELIKLILPSIPSHVFGGVNYDINNDGSVTFHYHDVGDATKFFFANRDYYIRVKPMIEMELDKKDDISDDVRIIIDEFYDDIDFNTYSINH